MASQVDICNLALSYLGDATILSITDDTKAARLLNRIWDMVRDDCLRDHPWNFAITRVALARLATTPVFGYAYQYQLPTDCLKVLNMDYDDIEFKIEKGMLLTDNEEANIRYIARITDTAQYDNKFVSAFAARLAAEIAINLTGTGQNAKMLLDIYQMKLDAAKSIDAQEGTPEQFTIDTWINSRI